MRRSLSLPASRPNDPVGHRRPPKSPTTSCHQEGRNWPMIRFARPKLEPVRCHIRLDICHTSNVFVPIHTTVSDRSDFCAKRADCQFVSRQTSAAPRRTRRLRATTGAHFACTSRQGNAPRLLRAPTTGLEGLPTTHPRTPDTPTDATLPKPQTQPPCQAEKKRGGSVCGTLTWRGKV